MPAGRFRVPPKPKAKAKKAPPPKKAAFPGTFQPFNPKQQARLAKGVAEEGARLADVKRQESAKKEYLKADYERELARQSGDTKKMMAMDKKIVSLHPKIERAGLLPSPSHNIIAKTVGNLTGAALYSPYGLALTGKAIGEDAGALALHRDPSFKHTGHIAKEIGKSTVEDIRHPLRNPGYTLLDALSVASMGAGLAGRAGAAGAAFKAAARTADTPAVSLSRGARAALTRPAHKGGSLMHRPAPGETELTAVNPETGKRHVVGHRLQPDALYLRPFHNLRTKQIQKHIDALADGQKPVGALAKTAEKLVGAPGVVGREIRATKRIVPDLAEERAQHVPKTWLKKDTAGPPGPTAEAFRKFNKPFRVFGVYLRPGYVATNLPGNVGMAVATQGMTKTAANMARARMAHSHYGPEVTDWLEHNSGTGRTESYQPRTKIGGFEHKAVQGIMRSTDRDFRVASALYRLREKGYKTRADFEKLMSDPHKQHEVDAIFRRTRKDAVDFDSLTPAEKEWVEAVYFYPWQSRGTAWTGRTALNRPTKSALVAQQGRQAQPVAKKLLGNIPRWMRGYIPTSHGLINPLSLFTPATPAQTAVQGAQLSRGLLGLPHALQNPSAAEEVGTPLVQLLGGEGIGQLVGSTGPVALAKRAGLKIPGVKAGKTFPKKGFWPAVGPFLAGGLWPRKADMDQVHKQYERQIVAEASSLQRISIKNKERIAKIPEEVKLIRAMGTPLPDREIAAYKGDLDAVELQNEFKQKYASKHGGGAYRSLPPANKVEAALAYIHGNGHFPKEMVDQLQKNASLLHADADLESYASTLWHMTGVGQYKSGWDSMVRTAKKRKVTPKK